MTALAAVAAAAPAVKISGMPMGSVASWLTLATIVAGIVMSYFKFVPKNRETISARANALEEERRGDMQEMRNEIREARKLAGEAVQTAQTAESRCSILRAVVSMLTAEITRTDPNNPVLKQATAMIRDSATGDLGLGKGMEDIARKVAELP